MNDLPRRGGVFGRSYDRYVEHQDNSTLSKVQQQYWTTKQAVFRKLGKKEDEHIVASDSELDTKLELFFAVRDSSSALQKIIEQYQDKLLALSHEENSLGRFLRDHGKVDKTRAGKMMTAVGKTMCYASQQRLAIRVPLVRLHQEVETFRVRAISDTMVTVNQMETARTDYRGALLWMKDISQELDPDTYKQLDKFRKVQCHVRKTKGMFEKYKLDSLQKIDLLAASRCNMFSHALATYQNTLLHFWEKTSRTMTAVADSFKGYQHYEFSMLKELTEVGKKLADDSSGCPLKPYLDSDGEIDKDRLLFFEEYHDEEEAEKSGLKDESKSDSLQNLFNSPHRTSTLHPKKDATVTSSSSDEPLLNLNQESEPINKKSDEGKAKLGGAISGMGPVDLLTNNPEIDDMEKDNMTLLNEILNSEANSAALSVFDQQWDSMFGTTNRAGGWVASSNDDQHNDTLQDFLPSQLLDMQKEMASITLQNDQAAETGKIENVGAASAHSFVKPSPHFNVNHHQTRGPLPSKGNHHQPPPKKTSTKDMSTWFNLFADLDPLANPDAIGKQGGEVDDRNC